MLPCRFLHDDTWRGGTCAYGTKGSLDHTPLLFIRPIALIFIATFASACRNRNRLAPRTDQMPVLIQPREQMCRDDAALRVCGHEHDVRFVHVCEVGRV